MSKQEMVTLYQNIFYDDLFGSMGIIVPSKRIRYKQNEEKVITEIIAPRGTQEFEEYIKNSFRQDTHPNWPHKGRLLISISIGINSADYKKKDIDNIAKSILDALKGLAYVDDVQVDALFVNKYQSRRDVFFIGIKKLKKSEQGWFLPPLMSDQRFKKTQTYTFKSFNSYKKKSTT